MSKVLYSLIGNGFKQGGQIAFQLLAARLLGPKDYGMYVAAVSLGTLLSVAMCRGIGTGIIRLVAVADSDAERRSVLSTGIALTLLASVVGAGVCIGLFGVIGAVSWMSADIVRAAVVYAVVFAWFSTISACVQGLEAFGAFAVVNGLAVGMSLALVWACERGFVVASPLVMLYAVTMGYGAASVLTGIGALRRFWSPSEVSLTRGRELGQFALFGGVAILSSSATDGVDRLILSMFISPEQLGLYQVYALSGFGVASVIVSVMVVAFFPSLCRSNDQVLSWLRRRWWLSAPGLALVAVGFIAVQELAFLVYGSGFGAPEVQMVLLMATAATMYLIAALVAWWVASFGLWGTRVVTGATILGGCSGIMLMTVLLWCIGMKGAIIARIVQSMIELGCYVRALSRRPSAPAATLAGVSVTPGAS